MDEIIDMEMEIYTPAKPKSFFEKLKEIWNKTIFAEWIETSKENKRIHRDARREAMRSEEIKVELKEFYKTQEIAKAKEKAAKGSGMSRFINGLKKEFPNVGSNESMDRMLGKNTGQTQYGQTKLKSPDHNEKLRQMLGVEKNPFGRIMETRIDHNEKIRQMLGGSSRGTAPVKKSPVKKKTIKRRRR